MRGRIRGITRHHREFLGTAWQFCATPADSIAHPENLAGLTGAAAQWRETGVPATAASSLAAANSWSLDDAARRFDAEDWWYRCRFAAPEQPENATVVLGFDGLATVADVWLNGAALLSSDNMFTAHEVRIDGRLQTDNELVLRFRSLDKALAAKRPRPRWRTPMLENQQLRWFRTTLLGRTPGWSPPAAAVGPWQPIWLEVRHDFNLDKPQLRATLNDARDRGEVEFGAQIDLLDGVVMTSAQLIVERDGKSFSGALSLDAESRRIHGSVAIDRPALWWPHTHGEPALYSAKALLTLRRGTDESTCEIALGPIGFRTLTVESTEGNFELRVNGVRIFCRGACWTPLDIVSLRAEAEDYRSTLELVRSAGMNMLRVGGTMVYESEEFLDLCDANGILVWQDFMFANMDYPDDEQFIASVATEVTQQLARLSAHPCVAVLCGNSEVEQQAAMWGAPRERWSPRLFHQVLPDLIAQERVDIPYWPSSAHGGAFPHQVNSGTTSYYGVGAYLRPPEDARRSELKFATECLAFANVPEDATLARMPRGLAVRVHHPEWKARSPRDLGAGWDFDDVRDFYLEQLFGLDAVKLRYADHDRYLLLGRIASGEVMAASFAEWRRRRSVCNGALIWFLRDLWPGAGWGVIDACGEPKAPWYYLRRALQPVAVSISDEGCNGLMVHVANDRESTLEATLSMTLYRAGEAVVAHGRRPVQVPPHQAIEIAAAEFFDGFLDASYAFRFGPPSHDIAAAQLWGADATLLTQACHFTTGLAIDHRVDVGLSAHAAPIDGDSYRLVLRSRRFAQSVTVQADGFRCDDQYFHLTPDCERVLFLRPDASGPRRALRGAVHAVNASASAMIELSA